MAEQGMEGSRCVLCLETFNDPRILPICGHTFCLNCLKQYGQKSKTDLACPMCRRKIRVPAGRLEELPKNYSLRDVLESSTTIAEPEGYSCAQHRDKELQLYCLDCNKVICLECIDTGHGSHCLKTISKMAANARIRLQDNVTRIYEKLLQTKQGKDKIEEEKKRLLGIFAECESALEKEFEKVQLYLEEQKDTLSLELMTVKVSLLKHLESEKRDIEAQEVLLTGITTDAEKVTDGKDKRANLKVVESFEGLNSRSCELMQMQMKIPEICSMTNVTFKPAELLNTSFVANEQKDLIGTIEVKMSSSNNDECTDQLQLPIRVQEPCAKRLKLSRSVDREGPHTAGDTSNTEAPLGIQQLNRTPDTFRSHFGSDSTASAQNSTDDNDKHCFICMANVTDKTECPCKDKFCRNCVDEYFSNGQPKCPICGKVFRGRRGNQPRGNMTWTESNWQHLPGYNDCGFIEIGYKFQDGLQGENHPNPGQPYKGTHETAYLPSNAEGRAVLLLLQRAFDAGLVFTIGKSSRTGQDNTVIWNISHKTTRFGKTGYPDPTYLNRVKAELAAKGIRAEV